MPKYFWSIVYSLSVIILGWSVPSAEIWAAAGDLCTGNTTGVSGVCRNPGTCNLSLEFQDTAASCGLGIVCCTPISATPPPAAPPVTPPAGTPVMVLTDVANPLGFSTVDGLLSRVLGYMQTVIVTIALIFLLVGGFLYITSAGDSGRIDTAKNCIFYALLGLALGIAAPAFIKQIYDILGASTPTLPAGGTSLTVLAIAKNVLDFLLSVVGVVAIIMLVVGAFMYLTAAGDEDRIDTGKKIAKYSIIGIFIALASLVLVRQIANFL